MEDVAVLGVAGAVGLIGIAAAVLRLLTAWKVFEKYGEPGWKGLIPFYNDYVEYGKCWTTMFGIIFIVVSIAYYAVQENEDLEMVANIASLASLVLSAIFSYKKSKAFGKGIGMTLILLFVPFIGNLMIGFGNAEYQGNQN